MHRQKGVTTGKGRGLRRGGASRIAICILVEYISTGRERSRDGGGGESLYIQFRPRQVPESGVCDFH